MLKEAFGTAETIDDARKQALASLNAPLEADVKVEIVQMPKKKTFGLFGGAPAKVRAWYEDGKSDKPAAPQQKTEQPKQQSKPQQPKPQQKQQPKQPKPQQPKAAKPAAPAKPRKEAQPAKAQEAAPEIDLSGIESKKTAATAYLEAVLKEMGVQGADVTCKETADDIYFEINCDEDYGNIIGRRGETLDALQYLTRLFVNRSENNNKRVALNVGDYRKRREDTLRSLARRQANRAVKYGRSCKLEPMNPYERRIIHTAVQEIEGVSSHSVGEGDRRRVVIVPEGVTERPERSERSEHGFDRFDRRERRGGGFDRRGRERREKYVPEIAEDREQKVDEASTARYGKITPKFPPRKPAAPIEQVSAEEAFADLAPVGAEPVEAPAEEPVKAVEEPAAPISLKADEAPSVEIVDESAVSIESTVDEDSVEPEWDIFNSAASDKSLKFVDESFEEAAEPEAAPASPFKPMTHEPSFVHADHKEETPAAEPVWDLSGSDSDGELTFLDETDKTE